MYNQWAELSLTPHGTYADMRRFAFRTIYNIEMYPNKFVIVEGIKYYKHSGVLHIKGKKFIAVTKYFSIDGCHFHGGWRYEYAMEYHDNRTKAREHFNYVTGQVETSGHLAEVELN